MSNTVYNQQRNLKRHLERLEVARQLNSKLKRKSARMLKVNKRISPGRMINAPCKNSRSSKAKRMAF
jgi:hypothetical protein